MPTADIEAESIDAKPQISLSIDERFLLRLLLPQKGSRQSMTLSAYIDQLLDFDEGEAMHYGISHSDDGHLFFNRNGLTDFQFDADQVALIKNAVELADDENRITREMLSLLAKIDLL